MILRIVLPFALVVAALPALAQDRTLPAGAYQRSETYGNQRSFEFFGTNPALQQGRSEAPASRRSDRPDNAR